MRHLLARPARLATGLILALAASAAGATASAATTGTGATSTGATSTGAARPVPASTGTLAQIAAPGGLALADSPGENPDVRRVLHLGDRAEVLPPSGAPVRQTPARPAHVPAGSPTYTLTVSGTNPAGEPATGTSASASIISAENPYLALGGDKRFHDGVATFTVPAGHYWVLGQFSGTPGHPGTYVDLAPQVAVTGATMVRLDARAADSKVQFTTARPATEIGISFELNFMSDAGVGGHANSQQFVTQPGEPAIYVDPMPARPAAGQLVEITTAWLASPSTARGPAYLYSLCYQSPAGTVEPQHFVVNQARLATENARFYSASTSHGFVATYQGFPVDRALGTIGYEPPETFPLRLTMYLTANPELAWTTQYFQSLHDSIFGGQKGPAQVFAPGQRFADDWGSYPLHPSSAEPGQRVSYAPPAQASATRAGDVLGLGSYIFSDNTPGHFGQSLWQYGPADVPDAFDISGSYEIDENGTKIAAGPAADNPNDYFYATAKLSPARSLITLKLTATEPAALNPLSTTNRTAWTWWSAHESGATLPSGWTCANVNTRSCAVQPLLTLRYGVLGEDLSGDTRPGLQVVRVSAGHLQLSPAAKITGLAVSVSFDGGKTWHQARIGGTGGSYAAVFNAPADALVTMRTIATDAAGGSVTQTLTNAYRVAASG